jgi:hypothetical protein
MPGPKPFKVTTLDDLTDEEKVQLLELLGEGYGCTDGKVTRYGLPYKDPYSGRPVSLAELAIMPGSTVVIGNNPISIAGYVADYLTN